MVRAPRIAPAYPGKARGGTGLAQRRRTGEYDGGVRARARRSSVCIAIQLTLCHHGKWDGTGYPNGLAADAIPISGRIVALADNYDALRTSRPYKAAFSHEH